MKAFIVFALLFFSPLVVGASWLGAGNEWYSASSGVVSYSHVQASLVKSDSWPHYERTVSYGSGNGFEAFGFGYSSGYAPAYSPGLAYGGYYSYNSFPSTYYYPPRFDGYAYHYGYGAYGSTNYGYSCGCVGWPC